MMLPFRVTKFGQICHFGLIFWPGEDIFGIKVKKEMTWISCEINLLMTFSYLGTLKSPFPRSLMIISYQFGRTFSSLGRILLLTSVPLNTRAFFCCFVEWERGAWRNLVKSKSKVKDRRTGNWNDTSLKVGKGEREERCVLIPMTGSNQSAFKSSFGSEITKLIF